jgi:hypothetical protein
MVRFAPLGLMFLREQIAARPRSSSVSAVTCCWPAWQANGQGYVHFAATREIGLVVIEPIVGDQLAGAKVRYRLRYRKIGRPY